MATTITAVVMTPIVAALAYNQIKNVFKAWKLAKMKLYLKQHCYQQELNQQDYQQFHSKFPDFKDYTIHSITKPVTDQQVCHHFQVQAHQYYGLTTVYRYSVYQNRITHWLEPPKQPADTIDDQRVETLPAGCMVVVLTNEQKEDCLVITP